MLQEKVTSSITETAPSSEKRRRLLVSGVASIVLLLTGGDSNARGLGIPYINPERAYSVPSYRNWSNPMGISNGQNNSAITPDGIPMDDNWIKNEVNAVLTYINTGERSFANLSDGQLEKILLSMSTYLRQIRVSGQNYELFSFLDEFNKLGDSLNISREESILFLQFYSRLGNIPKNLILSDGSHIDTDKIFGWRFGTGYNNRELCNRIQNALENKNQNPGEKLKTLIK